VLGQKETVQRVGARAEADDVRRTGQVRGSRGDQGTHYASDDANNSATRAQRRLALDRRPQVKMKMEVKRGTFSRPTRVKPKYGQPGGGLERTAIGRVPTRLVRTRNLRGRDAD